LPATGLPFTGQGPPAGDAVDLVAYVDGAAVHARVGLVLNIRGKVSAFPLPVCPDMNQQLVELYSIKVALARLVGYGTRCCVVSDSESALYTMLKFSTQAVHLRRGKVLRQVALLLSGSGMKVCLGWLPSELMPADVFSRCARLGCAPLEFVPSDEVLAKCRFGWRRVAWAPRC